MAKYGKNNYFDGVVLPEPKEEMLRRMAQGVDASKGYLESTDAGLLFDGPRSMECFFNLRQSDGTQRPAQFSTSMLAIAVTPMDAIMFHCGNKSLQVSRATIGDDIHAVISYDGATAMCYINGIEVGAMQPTAYTPSALFRIGDPLHITKSPVHFCRHFNYALSAEEVVALYNNGDPSEYVLPGTMKGWTPVEIIGENSHTWTGTDDPVSFNIKINRVLSVGGVFRITGSVSNYKSGTPYLNLGNSSIAYLPKDNSPFTLVVTLKKGSSTLLPYIYIYGGSRSEDKQLTITVDSIELVRCVAEYLPQNLIPTAESSVVQWLDSAPQLPEANGILPPLDASVGGYDLAAIGNPKIVV